MYQRRGEVPRLFLFNLVVSQDNNDISGNRQPGGGTVQAYLTATCFTFYGIGGKTGSIVNVQYLNLLVR